jgi:hypothetical protein
MRSMKYHRQEKVPPLQFMTKARFTFNHSTILDVKSQTQVPGKLSAQKPQVN